MASDPDFVAFVCDQASSAGTLVAKKMFGEYALYLDGKIAALICDNQLFVKPTVAGRAMLASVVEAPPYPGAKNCFLITDALDDREFVGALLRATADALPLPAPKKPKRPRKTGVRK